MRTSTPTDHDAAILGFAVSMDDHAIRADVQSAGVDPAALLRTVRAASGRLDRVLDARQESRDDLTLAAALDMDLDDVQAELSAAGIDAEAFARQISSRLPQL